MGMIQSFDADAFRAINGAVYPVLDVVMPFITNKGNFYGVIIFAVAVILIKERKRGAQGLALLIMAVLLSDFIANLLKHAVGRIRPCNAFDGVRLLVGCTESFSFPSGHAATIFTAMVFLSVRYRRYAPAFMAMAVSVAYSRVYVGVHYPLDTVGGALLGASVAFVFAEADRRYGGALFGRRVKTENEP
ncbi:MAG: phosphatase PAP2 family protein [Deltaproteobacteria bacterium]|nr:phosphatase PAP2 family protein [Deltaproteobacteria bacterium]